MGCIFNHDRRESLELTNSNILFTLKYVCILLSVVKGHLHGRFFHAKKAVILVQFENTCKLK